MFHTVKRCGNERKIVTAIHVPIPVILSGPIYIICIYLAALITCRHFGKCWPTERNAELTDTRNRILAFLLRGYGRILIPVRLMSSLLTL